MQPRVEIKRANRRAPCDDFRRGSARSSCVILARAVARIRTGRASVRSRSAADLIGRKLAVSRGLSRRASRSLVRPWFLRRCRSASRGENVRAMRPLWLVLLLSHACRGFTGRGVAYPGRADLFELSVVHLNDFHARFQQTGPTSGACYPIFRDRCFGGIARVYTATQRLMKERPNAIFLNAGDNYQGTLWYNVHRWNATVEFMNRLPHDAMTLGNHEFDDKIDGLVPFLKEFNAPVVVTNIDDSQEPNIQGYYKNSTIVERNGTKIGVIGVIYSKTDTIANTEKLKFLDEVESVNDEAQRLKNKGIDIIVVLSHCGLDIDRIMAANCPDVDVIVGGHSHSFLYTGLPPFIDTPVDTYPVVVTQEPTNRTVLIVQAAAFTKYLGNLTVWFDEEGEVVDWDGNPILLDYSIEEDPRILDDLVAWQKPVDDLALSPLGQTKVFLNSDCEHRECNLGNFIADAMVDSFVDRAENESSWTYAAVACTNSGGIRASIEELAENITYGDLIMVHPFENTWDTLELSGSSIRRLLVQGRPLIWSGMKVTYSFQQDGSLKVVDAKIRCRTCDMPKYEDLKDDQWYRLVVPSFLVSGGDGVVIFKEEARNHRVGTLDMDHLMRYVKKMSPVTAGLDRRLTFIRP